MEKGEGAGGTAGVPTVGAGPRVVEGERVADGGGGAAEKMAGAVERGGNCAATPVSPHAPALDDG